jgi:NADH-quinone oxidoreductase subunit L
MHDLWQIQYSFLIPLLPLVGAVLAGFFGVRYLKQQSHWPIWIGVGVAAVISLTLLLKMIGLSHGTGEEHAAAHGLATVKNYFTWIQAGDFKVNAGFLFDPLTGVMLAVVTGIGFLITVFAAGYMKGEEGYFRFFAYLGLFIFMMTCLVMGENLIMLYLGWEGVGLCSYLLIGYYYERPAAREAAKKAFIVNRVGDFGFAIGIMLIFTVFGTVSYFGDGAGTMTGALERATSPEFIAALPAWKQNLVWWIPFCLMLGAFGKSAQFPLYVWLPDAMEGPTPVSALIHAATMVTAGVYMVARCSTLFVGNAAAMTTIAVVGCFTAFFAATIALRQFDLKKVFAYSTVSQLGYMFIGVGVLAPAPAVFHLVTHAFFKALLFLSSGVVMHAMLGHLDMRKMSGLKRVLPKTNILMLIGCAALAGFPLTSGFFSKDEIIASAGEVNTIIWAVSLLTALITAYYTFRLYFRVFQGPTVVPTTEADGTAGAGHDVDGFGAAGAEAVASHSAVATGDVHESGVDRAAAHHGHDAGDHGHHNHEPALMILPLIVLAIGALFAGFFNWPTERLADFLGHSPSFQLGYEVASRANLHPDARHWGVHDPAAAAAGHAEHALFTPAMITGAVVSIAGILLASWLHLKDRARAEQIARGARPVTLLLQAKYYVDEIYDAAIVTPLRLLGDALYTMDRWIVDGFVWVVGFVPQLSGFALKLSTQRGSLQGYALTMILGVAVILLAMFVYQR